MTSSRSGRASRRSAGRPSIRYAWSNSVRSTLGRNFVNEARVGYSSSPVTFFDEMNVGMYEGTLANQKGFHLNFPSIGSQLDRCEPGAVSPGPQRHRPRHRRYVDLAQGQP